MSMPAPGSVWPPAHMAAVYREMRRDAMWYAGDPDRLAALADRRETGVEARHGRRRFGRQQPADYPRKRERRLHIPLPGDIATKSANLLFTDMPTITTPNKDTSTFLGDAVETMYLHEVLLGAAEQAAAVSGIFLRLTWDKDIVPDRPIPTTMQPDNAIPEYAFNVLRAVTFWRELDGGDTQTVYRHLERHEPGRIEHALYEGTPDNLGRAVPLTEHTETASLIGSLGSDGVSVETGIRMLTATYIPNMTPHRLHRASPYGRSDYAAPIHDQFASLDDTWTSWMRDIRLARARLVVPDGFLTSLGPGQGAAFDDDREVYSGLNMPPTQQGIGITLAQFSIRVEEHQRTAEAVTRKAVESAGYSAQSFGLEGGGEAVTATEVNSRDRNSTVTTGRKAGYWKARLPDFLLAYQALAAAQFGARITPERPTVEFRLAAESEQSKATTLELYARAGAVSTATKVKYRSPDMPQEDVDAEVAAILAETGAGAPDPGDTYPL